MITLRRSVILLILALTVFFSIEIVSTQFNITGLAADPFHIDTEIEGAFINIEPFVYAVGILSVISVLTLPALWRPNVYRPIALWLGVFLLLKAVTVQFQLTEIIGGTHAYLTATEIALLLLLIWRAHDTARQMHDFEEAVSNITFADMSRRIKKMDDAEDDIQTELIRSRRHHHPLTVMVIEPEVESIQVALNRTVQEVQRAMMSRYVITSLARVVSNQLRRTDVVVEQREKNRFIIISPDTTAANSAILADRIQAAAAVQLGVLVSCGVASFPDQALTFDELVQQAKSNLHSPVDIASAVYVPDETNGV